jgi:cell wall-associated NlpC family hydrolase
MTTTRQDVIRVARSYIDTPYHHMGRWPGLGLDCAGVMICIGRELGMVPPDFDVPAYSPHPDGNSLMAWSEEFFGHAVTQEELQPGDVLIVKVGPRPQHIAIVGDYVHGGLSVIHSCINATPSRVIETRLMWSRLMQFVAAFAMPGVE